MSQCTKAAPYLYAYFTGGFISLRMRWFFKYKKWISPGKDFSLAVTEYTRVNGDGEIIEMTGNSNKHQDAVDIEIDEKEYAELKADRELVKE